MGGLAVDLLVCRSNETSEVVCVIEGICALLTTEALAVSRKRKLMKVMKVMK